MTKNMTVAALCAVFAASCGGSGDPNDAPTTSGGTLTTNEDQAGSITVSASDRDGDSLSVVITTNPTKGTVAVAGGFTFNYTPGANQNGSDQFSYRVTDPDGAFADGTVNIIIAPQPDAPTVTGSTLTVDEDTQGAVSITAADVDAELLSAAISAQPSIGTVAVAGTNPFTFTYSPAANQNGNDSFTFRVTDASGLSATANVTVTVNPRPDAPVIVVSSVNTNEDSSVSGALASDPDGDAVTITVVTPPAHGALQTGNGSYLYAPASNYHGPDSFSVFVSDGTLQSPTAVVPVQVAPVNDAPLAVADRAIVAAGGPTVIDVLANDTDVDGDPLTVEVLEQPPGATATVVGGGISLTPGAGVAGPTSLRYRVVDAGGLESIADVRVVIGSAAPLFFTAAGTIYRHDFLADPVALITPVPAGETLDRFTTSADGAWLVYVSRSGGPPVRHRLWLKNLDDLSAPVREIATDASYFTNYLKISPDGTLVVFNDRYVTTADPATPHAVDGANTIESPLFTQDSQRLYYTVLVSGGGRIIKRADVGVNGLLANHLQMTADYPVAQGLGASFVLTPDETRIVSTGLLFVGGAVNSLKQHAFVTSADGSRNDAPLHPAFVHILDGAGQPAVTPDSRYAFYVYTVNHASAVAWADLQAPGLNEVIGNSVNQIVDPRVAGNSRTGFFRYLDGALQTWAWGTVMPTAALGGFTPVGGSVPAPRALVPAPDGSAVVFDGGAGIYATLGNQFSTATLLFSRPVTTVPTLLYAPDSSAVAAGNVNLSGIVVANPKAPGWFEDVLAITPGQPASAACMVFAGAGC